MTEVFNNREVLGCLEDALKEREEENLQTVQRIRSLIHRGVEYGRTQKVLGNDPDKEACKEYVDDVFANYHLYHDLLVRLEQQEEEAWLMLYNKMRDWANAIFMGYKIDGPLRIDCVEDCVPNAVMVYLGSTYHYDSDFEAWLFVLLRNVCRKHIRNQVKSTSIPDKETVSMDGVTYLFEKLSDGKEGEAGRIKELGEELFAAVEELSSEARQQLILLRYIDEYTFVEIAEILDRSMSATYKLHFDSLNELRKILGNRNSDNFD
jgi:RNA polymerase sigma factor (sigma-70 family)